MWHFLYDPSWIQALIYVLTLCALIWQARILIRQTRSQERAVRIQTEAIQHAEYARCASDYSALIRMLVENPSLHTIYDDLAQIAPRGTGWLNYNAQQKLLFNYIELNFELFERLYYLWQKKWIADETWSCSEKWLEFLSRHPIFADVKRGNAGMFGEDFEKYIESLMQRHQLIPNSLPVMSIQPSGTQQA